MTSDQIILLLLPVFGVSLAVAVVFFESWRDGVLPNQKPRKK
ncbi:MULTISPECIES: hypothetical protein [Neorhizobium]|nr:MULTISPECIES: hypothetical protein [Neorhizobium]